MFEDSKGGGKYFGKDYLTALREHYPELVGGEAQSSVDSNLNTCFVGSWIRQFDQVGADPPNRFVSLAERPWSHHKLAWLAYGHDVRMAGAYASYKGLVRVKTAIDLVLYSSLIWELKPKTILEFGSLQGGSALWFADQLEILCGHGEVHSFELCVKCIHPRASHPRLHFHEVDLRHLDTLDVRLLERLPHPWLAVDDAHANVGKLVPLIASYMVSGDYYVLEDVYEMATHETITQAVAGWQALAFRVDTKYTDAFGVNVTCAPNGWFVKQ